MPSVPLRPLLLCAALGLVPACQGDSAGQDGAYTNQGAYRCCLPNGGTSCCDGASPGTCFQYGGVYGACRAAGESFEAKVICAGCCPGLARLADLVPGDRVPPENDGLPAGCDERGPDSVQVCAACGDGACTTGENRCNCPADCR